MKTTARYQLRNNFWGTKVNLYQDNNVLGQLKSALWQSKHIATIDEQTYRFETKGLFVQYTNIYDENDQLIGDIDYSVWNNQATVQLHGKTYLWKSTGWLMQQWNLTDDEGGTLSLNSDLSGKGSIDGEEASPLLLMTSVFLQSFYMYQLLLVLFLALLVVCVR